MGQDSYFIFLEKYHSIGALVQMGIIMKKFYILKYILQPAFLKLQLKFCQRFIPVKLKQYHLYHCNLDCRLMHF